MEINNPTLRIKNATICHWLDSYVGSACQADSATPAKHRASVDMRSEGKGRGNEAVSPYFPQPDLCAHMALFYSGWPTMQPLFSGTSAPRRIPGR